MACPPKPLGRRRTDHPDFLRSFGDSDGTAIWKVPKVRKLACPPKHVLRSVPSEAPRAKEGPLRSFAPPIFGRFRLRSGPTLGIPRVHVLRLLPRFRIFARSPLHRIHRRPPAARLRSQPWLHSLDRRTPPVAAEGLRGLRHQTRCPRLRALLEIRLRSRVPEQATVVTGTSPPDRLRELRKHCGWDANQGGRRRRVSRFVHAGLRAKR